MLVRIHGEVCATLEANSVAPISCEDKTAKRQPALGWLVQHLRRCARAMDCFCQGDYVIAQNNMQLGSRWLWFYQGGVVCCCEHDESHDCGVDGRCCTSRLGIHWLVPRVRCVLPMGMPGCLWVVVDGVCVCAHSFLWFAFAFSASRTWLLGHIATWLLAFRMFQLAEAALQLLVDAIAAAICLESTFILFQQRLTRQLERSRKYFDG